MATKLLLLFWVSSTMADKRLLLDCQVLGNTHFCCCWAVWAFQGRAPQEDCEAMRLPVWKAWVSWAVETSTSSIHAGLWLTFTRAKERLQAQYQKLLGRLKLSTRCPLASPPLSTHLNYNHMLSEWLWPSYRENPFCFSLRLSHTARGCWGERVAWLWLRSRLGDGKQKVLVVEIQSDWSCKAGGQAFLPNSKHRGLLFIFKVRSKLQFRGMVRNDYLLFSYIYISVEAQQVVAHVKVIG